MKCPVCHIVLRVMDRSGVEIDYCSQCRGVWLDRGELEKIIEQSHVTAHRGDDDDDDDRRYHHHGDGRQHGGQPRKKEGFFSRLFDFD
ncbi:MAG: zf-TFIIB domain-containing protein [Gemmataceae bacterium]|nr:zf-TFIIB domain-containing protein [Gemmataceae bacterium]